MTATLAVLVTSRAESYARDAARFRDAARSGRPVISAAEDARWAVTYAVIAATLRRCVADADRGE